MDGYDDYTEQSFIGLLISNPHWIDDCKSVIKPECLKSTFLQRIYKTILELHANGTEILLSTVSQAAETKDFPQETLVSILAKHAMNATGNILSLADVILRNYQLRTYVSIINKAPDIVATDIEGTLECTIEKLTELRSMKQAVKAPTLASIAQDYRDTYFNPNYNPEYMHLGFPLLDSALGGIEKGSVTCIGARPSVGKSALANQIMLNHCRYEKGALFSFEMTQKQMIDRIVAYESGIPFDRIKNGKQFCGKDEEIRFNASYDKIMSNENLHLMARSDDKGTKFSTVSDIAKICRSIDGLSLIVIDYLQLIKAEKSRNGNRTSEVGDISKAVKELALNTGAKIIILSQLNRGLEYRQDKEPVMSDLRESGDIEQDSDNILFLWNLDKNDRSKKGCKIDKCRNGALKRIEMSFNWANMHFSEVGVLKEEKSNSGKSGFINVDGNPWDDEDKT